MAGQKKQFHREHEGDATAKATRVDALRIAPPTARLSADDLHAVIRKLLLCHGPAERRLIADCLYRGGPLSDTAAALALPLARAQELIDSIARREQIALAHIANETKLARWQERERRAGRAGRKEPSDNG